MMVEQAQVFKIIILLDVLCKKNFIISYFEMNFKPFQFLAPSYI